MNEIGLMHKYMFNNVLVHENNQRKTSSVHCNLLLYVTYFKVKLQAKVNNWYKLLVCNTVNFCPFMVKCFKNGNIKFRMYLRIITVH